VTADASAAFGLAEGTPVSVGWSDALAAMLAVGAFDSPTAFVLSGTSSIVGVSTRDGDLPPHPRLLELPSTCAPLTVHYGPTESSGASVGWLARLLRCDEAEVLELAAAAAPDELPVFVPYLHGERAPLWRTDVRGVFLGLADGHGPAEVARAVVAGVCLSEADVLDLAEDHVAAPRDAIAVAGRGAGGAPWREARLAALARPLRVLDEADASALGAAMLGAAAASGGRLEAASALRGAVRPLVPAAEHAEQAARSMGAYRRAAAMSTEWADFIPPIR